MLEQKLTEWVQKVLAAHDAPALVGKNTYRMIEEVDKIIAEAFDHEPVLSD